MNTPRPALLACWTLAALGGCATYRPGTTTEDRLVHDRLVRTFRVYVPTSYNGDRPFPLLLMFHGGMGNARQFERSTSDFKGLADREGIILVYPQGVGTLPTWNAGDCCGTARRTNVDDVSFTRVLLDHLESALNVDKRRIYAAGMSNGGMMAHRLACRLSDRLAAVAAVAGSNVTHDCAPEQAVSILAIHGSKDAHVPYEGGTGCGPGRVETRAIPDLMADWSTRHACTDTQVLRDSDGVHCEAHTGCRSGAEVRLCRLEGTGHYWPGGATEFAGVVKVGCPQDGAMPKNYPAHEEIWSFFKLHARP